MKLNTGKGVHEARFFLVKWMRVRLDLAAFTVQQITEGRTE
jgi:hypothetical protein